MSIDLGGLLDQGAPLIRSAIQTSGTRITVTRSAPDRDATVNPGTLAVGGAETTVISEAPAIVIAVNAQGQPLGPGQTWQATRYRILLLPEVTAVEEKDRALITDARDPGLTGRTLLVDEVIADTPGLIRALNATMLGAG